MDSLTLEQLPSDVFVQSIVEYLDLPDCFNACLASKQLNSNVRCFNRYCRFELDVKADSLNDNLLLISKACPNLEEIHYDLKQSYHFNQETINNISKLSMLRSLLLPLHYTLEKVSLRPVLESCHQLVTLDVASFQDESENLLQLVAENLDELESLNISGCVGKQITNSDIVKFAPNLCNLRQLQVSSDIKSVDGLNCKALKAIANNCRNLQVLAIGGISTRENNVTDEALQAIASGCPDLQRLALRGASVVTDAGIKLIAHNCHQLTHVDLLGCVRLTDFSLSALASNFKLNYLNFCYCHHITDIGLKKLAMHCKRLKFIDLDYCFKVTDEGIKALAANCKDLKALDVEGSNISRDGQMLIDSINNAFNE